MKRIEIVKGALAEAKTCVTASDLAAQLGLQRANVSSDLNKLCDLGFAVKSGSKPVYYRYLEPVEARPPEQSISRTVSDFDDFIQHNPSLTHCWEQARAAVLYPPHGMHIFLYGETGVGKNHFADFTYKMAVAEGVLSRDAPFITFNCADYANNPQLLVSHLFGCVKGAYTGADKDLAGLLERANGGILFLDEVHRMPVEGQEILFSYIDRGVFRRLGDTHDRKNVQVRLICATTENPEIALLGTFIRRIPMLIKIPNLAQRGIEERYYLIRGIFLTEAKKLGHSIFVSNNSLRSLLSYKVTANVGGLQSDIRILCARAYSEFRSGKTDRITISSYDLPDNIKAGLYSNNLHRQIWRAANHMNGRYVEFRPDEDDFQPPPDHLTQGESIYQRLDRLMQDPSYNGCTEQERQAVVDDTIQCYYANFRFVSRETNDPGPLERLVGPEIIQVTDLMIQTAERRLRLHFGTNMRYGLSMHLEKAVARILAGQAIHNPQLDEIRVQYPDLFDVALECLRIAEEHFELSFPEDEAGFIALFFRASMGSDTGPQCAICVIAHGTGVGTGLANTANDLLQQKIVVGFDAQLMENPEEVYRSVKAYLSKNGTRAALLLVDMGSLTSFAEELSRELNIEARALPLVSTLHVLSAARKAMLGNPLSVCYDEARRVDSIFVYGGVQSAQPAAQGKTLYILTACSTSHGSALMLKTMLEDRLVCADLNVDIKPIQYTGDTALRGELATLAGTGRVLCIVSAFPVHTQIPFFELTEIVSGNGIARIQELLDFERAYNNLRQNMLSTCRDLSGQTFEALREVLSRIEEHTGIRLWPDVFLGVLTHTCFVLERSRKNEPVDPMPGADELLRDHPDIFRAVQEEFTLWAQKNHCYISRDEMVYLAAFFAMQQESENG